MHDGNYGTYSPLHKTSGGMVMLLYSRHMCVCLLGIMVPMKHCMVGAVLLVATRHRHAQQPPTSSPPCSTLQQQLVMTDSSCAYDTCCTTRCPPRTTPDPAPHHCLLNHRLAAPRLAAAPQLRHPLLHLILPPYHSLISSWSACSTSPAPAYTSSTMPSCSALMDSLIFMASITASSWPTSTWGQGGHRRGGQSAAAVVAGDMRCGG